MYQQGAKAPKRPKAPEINVEKMKRFCGGARSLSWDFIPFGGQTVFIIDNKLYFTPKGDKMRDNDRVWLRSITTCPPRVIVC